MAMVGVMVTEVVTTGAVTDITSPVAGQLIFYAGSTDVQGYYYYDGTDWWFLAIRPE